MDPRLLSMVLPLAVSAVVCAAVAALGWQRRSRPGAPAFILMMLANAVWATGYAGEIAAPTLGSKVLWAKLQYFGIVAVPMTFLLFALRYSGQLARVRPLHLVALSVEPALTLALLWLPATEQLLWRRVELDTGGPVVLLGLTHGPWFWANAVYSYVVFAVATYLITIPLLRRPGPYRLQAMALTIAVLAPWIANAVHLLGLSPLPSFDPTPLAFTLTGVALFWGLLRFGLLDLIPVARDAVIREIRDGVLVLDQQYRIVDLNPAAEELLDTTAAGAIGRPVESMLTGFEALAPQLTEGEEVRTELQVGDWATCELRAWPLTGPRAPHAAAVVLLRDMTRQRHAEVALRDSQRRLEVLFEQVPAMLWTTDRDLVFELATGSDLAALDLEPGRAVGMSLFEYFRTDDAGFAPIASHVAALQGRPSTFELEWHGRGFECHVEPLRDASGQIVGTIGVGRDVSERLSLERRLRQSQKMDAIGRMAGGVAHDFNNLLTAVAGYAQLAQEDLESLGRRPEALEGLRRDIEAIRVASGRATAITSQLLAFSRKQIMEPRVIDPNGVLLDMDKMLERLSDDHVRFVFDLRPDVDCINADPTQLEQVIINLVLNARDAMPDGGEIRIGSRNVDVDEAFLAAFEAVPAGRYVVVSVADEGTGMDESTKAHVFEPFFTTKQEGRGTGLGLSTVYGIVKQSAGYIVMTSQPGEGTTFEVYFPAVSRETLDALVEGAAGGLEERSSASETILLVEDEEMVRVLAARVLGDRGYRVLEATDGRDALDVVARHGGTIDLVVTDVVMPGMNGQELAERLDELIPGTPVLFISGYTGGALVEHGVIDDDVAFLQKPFTPQRLAHRVREVLDESR